VCLLAVLFGCGSSSSPAAPQHVKDMLGRTCKLEAMADTITCDQKPVPSTACTNDETPCFQVDTTGDTKGPGAICASCCGNGQSTKTAADCSLIVCTQDAECPAEFGTCTKGRCMNGA
jgi:hypothetical protein